MDQRPAPTADTADAANTADTADTATAPQPEEAAAVAASKSITFPKTTRRDLQLAGGFVAAALLGITAVWWTAPARHVEHQTAAQQFQATYSEAAMAQAYDTAGVLADTNPLPVPLVVNGLLITAAGSGGSGSSEGSEGSTVTAFDTLSGQNVWSYSRTDAPLCAAMGGWNNVNMVFRTERGCGDVVALQASDGTYQRTRSSNAAEQVLPVRSNDRVGILSADRVELWRSDLVRTVEFGHVEAPQEADQQPEIGQDCAMNSALTRTELLATVQTCGAEAQLSLQKVTPEDSREPEMHATVQIPTTDPESVQVVAVGQHHSVVYVAAPKPMLLTFDEQGIETARFPLDAPLDVGRGLIQPIVADLPHHITWFADGKLFLFTPESMQVAHVLDDALGLGIGITATNSLYYPTAAGIRQVNWTTGETEAEIPVQREVPGITTDATTPPTSANGSTQSISLAQANGVILEKRGQEVAILKPRQ
ncbi:hypothetical protein NQ015_04335 [Corynebacterium sp. 153RC1]|uniref:Rv3212 family protein n=1 Tax=unclassified Corynebacterium TaxID=2624378 RepID=UPI00211BFE80|nr:MULTISPECIES: hypothetical protein [unclassified Corynebacterium]MCQ9371202.1 hypothetical protein [Corynebacterium sp. 35RC1]MCQ9352099.1 hypothetical protein [Corynebacterium sp. 209RC1]MCQ9354101.1 hypothetical protein [Corynebacterium sp. 1222RC1]MCQ9356381.1 hypothetical protein [Corynebacterium sp. 122RC1]MCQ9358483.1 hypothetical protein [Corynebacterium sp. 142RC1]